MIECWMMFQCYATLRDIAGQQTNIFHDTLVGKASSRRGICNTSLTIEFVFAFDSVNTINTCMYPLLMHDHYSGHTNQDT